MQTTTETTKIGDKPTKTERVFSPLVKALGVLLGLQILAALALGLGAKGFAPAGRGEPILDLDPDRVTEIRVQGRDGKSVVLTKKDKGWVIPSLGDLPASEHKVGSLLEKLDGLAQGLPVGTSQEALERFKVADEAFERKLTLTGGDGPPAVLFLGDSPGFRRLYVRAGGDAVVHEAELGLFDAPDRVDDWTDHSLLHLDEAEIERLTFGDLALEPGDDDRWRIAGLTAEEAQDEDAVAALVRALASLDFIGVLAEGEEPAAAPDAAPTAIGVTLKSGETIDYRIVKMAEGNDYLLEVSNRPQRFTLANYQAEDLIGVTREGLLKRGDEEAEAAAQEQPPVEPALSPERAEGRPGAAGPASGSEEGSSEPPTSELPSSSKTQETPSEGEEPRPAGQASAPDAPARAGAGEGTQVPEPEPTAEETAILDRDEGEPGPKEQQPQ